MIKAWLMLTAAIVSNVIANIAFKRAVEDVIIKPELGTLLSILGRPWFWLGAVACISLLASYLYAIKYIELGIAYALVTSGALALITALSLVLFDAQLGVTKVVGMCFVIVGVWLLVVT